MISCFFFSFQSVFFSIDNLGHFFGFHNLLIRTMVWMIVTQVKLSIRGAYYRLLRTLICYEKWIDSILAVCTFLSSYELNLRSCSQENTWLDPGSFKHSVHSINHRTLCRLPRTPSLLSSPTPPHPTHMYDHLSHMLISSACIVCPVGLGHQWDLRV